MTASSLQGRRWAGSARSCRRHRSDLSTSAARMQRCWMRATCSTSTSGSNSRRRWAVDLSAPGGTSAGRCSPTFAVSSCHHGRRHGAGDAAARAASVGPRHSPSFSRDPRFDADGAGSQCGRSRRSGRSSRRVTPGADYREFIACGVLNWRALYITALGSSSQSIERRGTAIGSRQGRSRHPRSRGGGRGRRPDRLAGPFDRLRAEAAESRAGNNHPVRYLLLTKGEPQSAPDRPHRRAHQHHGHHAPVSR